MQARDVLAHTGSFVLTPGHRKLEIPISCRQKWALPEVPDQHNIAERPDEDRAENGPPVARDADRVKTLKSFVLELFQHSGGAARCDVEVAQRSVTIDIKDSARG